MNEAHLATVLGPAIARALQRRGFASLTSVQEAVLEPAFADRDLRITSQTGSGKTVAVGFALREIVSAGEPAAAGGVARPRVLFVAPTRELARQVEEELAWLYVDVAKVASVTGGASFRDERRALGAGPAVVVATPGRLLDHLTRGSIDARGVGAVVLDEADRLLDLGFREDLEKILAQTPEDRRTHLVSATFPREVRALADAVQNDPVHVEGTRLGQANVDIDHVIYLCGHDERTNAIVNLLLARPDEQTLIFARTRADVARIARELSEAGFGVSSLSGEMEQPARTRALAGFKRGDLRVLVATDVAARGLDVQDIARVIHADPPNDADTYTHRSGRTGRAGRKGTSCVLVAPPGLRRVTQLLSRARVAHRVEPLPTAAEIRDLADERLFADLAAEPPEGFSGFDERTWSLATRIARGADPARTIARLLLRGKYAGPAEPRELRPRAVPPDRPSWTSRTSRAAAGSPARAPSAARAPAHAPAPARAAAPARAENGDPSWVSFRVTWGELHGADPRRMLAVVCRRGGVDGRDVGAIRLGRTWSIVDVSARVADSFEAAASKPDPRNPRMRFERDRSPSPPPPHRAKHAHEPKVEAGAERLDKPHEKHEHKRIDKPVDKGWGERPLLRRGPRNALE